MSDRNTHALVVVANPDPESLTQQFANEVALALSAAATVELADLSREGFDPRWTTADRLAYQGRGAAPADVIAEQQRLDRATDLILLFPVYWWSLPALLKGWIDRVFISGWAFDYTVDGGIAPKLQTLTTHVVPIAASDAAVYQRHGYEQALRTQLAHGVIDFCGATQGIMEFVYDSEDPSEAVRVRNLRRVASALALEVTGTAGADAAGRTSISPMHNHDSKIALLASGLNDKDLA